MNFKWNGERLNPTDTTAIELAIHLQRYLFASDYASGKRILDASCGAGYGSYFLKTKGAMEVHGVDICAEAIAFAKHYYFIDNVRFEIMDVEDMRFDNNFFDVVVSFETVEHLRQTSKFFSELTRVLKQDGLFIFSVPNKQYYSDAGIKNRFHFNEMYYADIERLSRQFFKRSRFYYQLIPDLDKSLVRFLKKVNINFLLPHYIKRKLTRLTKKVNMEEHVFNGTNFEDFMTANGKLIDQYRVVPIYSPADIDFPGNFIIVAEI